ncbi:MAG: AraC family ligand binding domain-containing protein [Parabacteroides sp.]
MENILIEETLNGLGTAAYANYLAHAYCTAGSCRFVFNGKPFIFRAGDLMIVRKGTPSCTSRQSNKRYVRTISNRSLSASGSVATIFTKTCSSPPSRC